MYAILLNFLLYFNVITSQHTLTQTIQIPTIPDAIVIMHPLSYNIINPDKGTRCTGAVISEQWIITAAHCALNENLHIITDKYNNQYHIGFYFILTDVDIAYVKILDSETFKVQPLKLAKRQHDINYLFGSCPYYLIHSARILQYDTPVLLYTSDILKDQIVYNTDKWVVLNDEFSCGGDSGAPLLEYQNNKLVITGILSAISQDILGIAFQETRGYIVYTFSVANYLK